MNLDEFMAGPDNKAWSTLVLAAAEISLFPVYNEALQRATLEQLAASGCALAELVACGQQHESLFLRQVVALIALTAGAPLEQAYGPGDGGPASWKPSQVLGVSRDFLVPHLIVFFLFVESPRTARRVPEKDAQCSAGSPREDVHRGIPTPSRSSSRMTIEHYQRSWGHRDQ